MKNLTPNPMEQKKQQLREEFYKTQCEEKEDSDRLKVYENDAELVADWWLSRFDHLLADKVAEIALKLENYRHKRHNGEDAYSELNEIINSLSPSSHKENSDE